ncbi:hypothetical protein FEM41_20185 [Jejubacter calystegiae]|uniref:Uncharacterized protein n=1 Tax=Jejubacter calystegiae TaxID=2579935 RepID=A0A4P8YNU9_9ENTR|nr:hypothetical protein [Jejubacter calystegiae]QCT21806.1 hypothetical protein FEM41_20185 [Jejubacter calystegiae]
MRLSIRDIEELKRIKAMLTEDDHERIYAEVESLTKSSNPITALLRNIKPDSNTEDAVSFMEDHDIEYQEQSAEMLWDLLTFRVTSEYVMEIFKRRHQEAA